MSAGEDIGRPSAVLWDLDGTIVDTEPTWMAAERRLAREHGAQWTEEDGRAMVGNDLIDSGRYIRDRMGLELTAEQIVELLVDRIAAEMEHDLPWRPGALELLADVHAQGVPQALVTMSYRAIVTPVMRHLGAATFDTLVVGDEVRHGKPHPEPYLEAARRLGLEPTDCIAIEDSPTGAASAQAAGCRVVVVPNHVPVPVPPGGISLPTLAGESLASLTGQLHSVPESV